MMDMAKKADIDIDINLFAKKLGVPVVPISARKNEGTTELKTAISFANKFAFQEDSIDVNTIAPELVDQLFSGS